MAKASKELLTELGTKLDAAADGLKSVESKTMFGCKALFASGNVFALVWKEGRLGFRLPEEAQYEAAMGLSGAAPWKAGPMTMAHWVLVPEGMHGQGAKLKAWAGKAHAMALAAPAKAKARKATGKKVVTKKAPAKEKVAKKATKKKTAKKA